MKTQWFLKSKASLIATGLLFAVTSLSSVWAQSNGENGKPLNSGGKFIVHEWGTFTSVQGADGELIHWNPFVPTDLPRFVYDRTRAERTPRDANDLKLGIKFGLWALQRMETPVIYFYSDRERTANVTVEFPEGTVTEWYPGVTDFGPKFSKDFFQTEKRSFIEWDGLRILPLRQNENLDRTLPVGQPDSHYFAARGTGSDFVQMNSGTDAARQAEREKFLFYRGLGSFPSPLHVAVDSENALTLRNTTGETLKHLFVLSVREGQGHFTELNNLSPEENRNVPLHSEHSAVSSAELVNQLGYAVKQALVDEGLYVQEANAMVETWKNSWFSESGVRVLYTIPSTWTDRVLPLRVEPSPKQIARAFVGRAEVITPALEWELLQQIVRFGDKDPTARSRAVSEAQRLGLGRFAGAAIQRVLGKQPSDAFRKQAKEFQAALDPNSPAGTLARK